MESFLGGLKISVLFLGAAVVVTTLLPLLRSGRWWIRIWDFPRLQIALVGLLTSVSSAFFFAPEFERLELVILSLLAVCTIYQVFCILPYTPVYRKQVQRSRTPLPKKIIRLLIANVLIENRDAQKLLKVIEKNNPDVIVLAEPDDWWAKEIEVLKAKYPQTILHPLDNAYGMLFFSRLPLVESDLRFLIEDDIPSIHAALRLSSGDVIHLHCLHPRPPAPQESLRSTERDAELLLVGREINKKDIPTIVCGDLNDVAWSRTTRLFQKISGLLDPRVGRGMYSSFHAHYPPIRFPLDHVFHSNHFRLIELKRLPDIGSDHFPIYVSLAYEKTAELVQERPEADPEDHAEAIETIQEAFDLQAEEGKRGFKQKEAIS